MLAAQGDKAAGPRRRADAGQPGVRPGLWRDRGGNAILEFALIAPAFIALILAVLHTALIYLAQEGLQTAVENAARLIATGNAQTLTRGSGSSAYTGMTAADFKTAICQGITGTDASGSSVTYARSLPPFLSCSRLAVNVQLVATGCTAPVPVTPTFTISGGVVTATGTAFGQTNCAGTSVSTSGLATSQSQLAILQLYYLWPTSSGPLGLNFGNRANSSDRLIAATQILTIEGYSCPTGTTTC